MAILLPPIEATLPHQNEDILKLNGVIEVPHQPTEATPLQRRVEGDLGGVEGIKTTMEGEDHHPLVTDKREVEVKIVIVVEKKDLQERESLLTLTTLAMRRQAAEVAVEEELQLLQETVPLRAVGHLEAEAHPFFPIRPLLLFTLQQTLYCQHLTIMRQEGTKSLQNHKHSRQENCLKIGRLKVNIMRSKVLPILAMVN